MTDLWPHQEEAVQRALSAPRGGFMFAMEMGTGKTLAALETLKQAQAKRILVLCPKSVVDVWGSEVRKHVSPTARVTLLNKGDSKARVKQLEIDNRFVVVNYEAAWREPLGAALLKQDWDAVIFDESHRIKRTSGVASRFAARLKAPLRLALTGTPMPHSPLDIWAQYRAIDPSVFPPTYTAFRSHYTRMAIGREQWDHDTIVIAARGGILQRYKFANLDELQARFQSISYRVRARDVLELPEATDAARYCDLEPTAMRSYRELERDLVTELATGTVSAANTGVKIMRLQQLTGGSLPGGDDYTDVSMAKSSLLRDVLEDCAGEPVVVFCRFLADMERVHRIADGDSLELSGRRNELARWQEGQAHVLAVQIQAGGVGIDLTRARIAIYYSLGYSLGDYMQSRARLHRPGQHHPVEYIHLVARGTVDEAVYAALAAREDVVKTVVDGLKA